MRNGHAQGRHFIILFYLVKMVFNIYAFYFSVASQLAESHKNSNTQDDSVGVSGSGGGWGFSASASMHVSMMSSSMNAGSHSTQNEKTNDTETQQSDMSSVQVDSMVKYQPDFLQSFREIRTTVAINGETATMLDRKYVNSIPANQALDSDQLRQKAEDEILYRFEGSKGRIWRNTYTECGLSLIHISEPTRPY